MNIKRLIGAVIVLFVIGGVAVWWLVLKDDAPAAVDLTAAAEQLDKDLAVIDDPADEPTDEPTDDPADEPTDDPADEPADEPAVVEETAAPTSDGGADGIDGTWIIDDEIGSFDFETASGSFAGFRVDEELVVGAVTAVGRSGGVAGSLTISDGELVAAEVVVDMTMIVSNDSRRERAIRRTLDTSAFPTATFVLAEPVALGAGVADGEGVTVQARGDLTVKGITQPVTFSISAVVRDDDLGVIVGSADIVWAAFGVSTPSAAIVVSVADEGIVEFQLVVAKP